MEGVARSGRARSPCHDAGAHGGSVALLRFHARAADAEGQAYDIQDTHRKCASDSKPARPTPAKP